MSVPAETSEGEASAPPLRLFRPDKPAVALGLAVNHLMTKPAFASLPFGAWSRVLVGQINRGHYAFVIDRAGRVGGFIGWALTTRDKAEDWVEGRRGLSSADSNGGDCIVFNAWSADGPAVQHFILRAAREIVQGRKTIYFKRYYADGSSRPVRLAVNDFVAAHVASARAAVITLPSSGG
jgi:hemolysin-activating ACP:hemolysin acyltransferase